MNWRETLQALDPYAELQAPADPANLMAAGVELGVALPPDVQELYGATDGMYDTRGLWFVMWQLEDLVSRNLEAWRLEGDGRRRYLGFGDDGTGNPFCVLLGGDTTIYTWSPIDQLAYPLAPDLLVFWTGWLTGTIGT